MKHKGQIVETRVRASGMSISNVAKALNVNRQTLYNWFAEYDLEPYKILRVGKVIHHDFTEDFPKLINPLGSPAPANLESIESADCAKELNAVWAKYGAMAEKYFHLKEDYDQLKIEHEKALKSLNDTQ